VPVTQLQTSAGAVSSSFSGLAAGICFYDGFLNFHQFGSQLVTAVFRMTDGTVLGAGKFNPSGVQRLLLENAAARPDGCAPFLQENTAFFAYQQ